MSLNPTSFNAADTPFGSAAPVASAAEGEQRFLKLLVAQLNNQDPLSPLDNAQLTSQLAQMSTVSGIEKLNAAFASLMAQSSSSQVMQSASLIGRSVLVPGQQIALADGAAHELNIEVPQGAQRLQMNILDASGAVVRRLEASSVSPGTLQMAWDGLSDKGEPLGAGTYHVQALATGEAGALPVTVLVPGRVASVAQAGASNGSGIWLDLDGGQRVKLSDVRLIS